jgi:hypothetical protein
MCRIAGCDGKALARGLCAKHYSRQRRHGDVDTVKRRGRNGPPSAAMLKELFPDWSPRTLAAYTKAFEQLRAAQQLTGTETMLTDAIAQATRSNGTLNVSKFVRIAEDKAAMTPLRFVQRNPESTGEQDGR